MRGLQSKSVIPVYSGQKLTFTKDFTREIPAVVICHGLTPATRYSSIVSRSQQLTCIDFGIVEPQVRGQHLQRARH
jgi:hypothetical protein